MAPPPACTPPRGTVLTCVSVTGWAWTTEVGGTVGLWTVVCGELVFWLGRDSPELDSCCALCFGFGWCFGFGCGLGAGGGGGGRGSPGGGGGGGGGRGRRVVLAGVRRRSERQAEHRAHRRSQDQNPSDHLDLQLASGYLRGPSYGRAGGLQDAATFTRSPLTLRPPPPGEAARRRRRGGCGRPRPRRRARRSTRRWPSAGR